MQGGPEPDVKALVGILSPGSRLMQAVHSADADGIIKFMFPPERLPTHTQLLLAVDTGRWALQMHALLASHARVPCWQQAG